MKQKVNGKLLFKLFMLTLTLYLSIQKNPIIAHGATDVTPPTMTYENVVGGHGYNGVWYTNQSIYTIELGGISDTESGVSKVQCPTWTEYNGQDDIDSNWTYSALSAAVKGADNVWRFTVNTANHNNEDGSYTTHIYAWDNVGNSAALRGFRVVVDRVAPTAPSVSVVDGNGTLLHNGAMVGSSGNALHISMSSTDNYSGIDHYEYSNDNGVTWTSTGTTTIISADGKYSLLFRSVDIAGNKSEIVWPGVYTLDHTNPTITYNPSGNSISNTDQTISITPSNLGSFQVNQYKYRVSHDNGTTWGNWVGYNMGTDNLTSGIQTIQGTSPSYIYGGAAPATAPSGYTIYDDHANAGMFCYQNMWYGYTGDGSSFYNNSYEIEADNTKSSSITFLMNGTQFIYLAQSCTGRSQNNIKVYIDGKYNQTFNGINSYTGNYQSVQFISPILSNGVHVITLQPDADSLTGSQFLFDRLDVKGTLLPITQLNNYTSSSIVLTEGKNIIQTVATNNSNSSSTITSNYYMVDKTPPTVPVFSLDKTGWCTFNLLSSISGSTDFLSGVKKYQYSTDGGVTWNDFSSPVPFATSGSYSIIARSVDYANNVSPATAAQTFNVDTTISVTYPVSTTYTINPNNANPFVAPDITLKNNNAHIGVAVNIQSFKAASGGTITINDVVPTKYADWTKLNTAQTKSDIALAICVKSTDTVNSMSWSKINQTTPLYAKNITSKTLLGILNPSGTGNLSLSALCGLAWNNAYTANHIITFVFDASQN